MTPPPDRPKIYHITHVKNLRGIAADGGLFSDARAAAQGGPSTTIGLSAIKQRRIALGVRCHTRTMVGQYVPFYFCPRSIMLYVIHRANHPDLTYREGQEEIVHLEADLHRVVQWAEKESVKWAFSLSNAGAFYATFLSRLDDLDQLDWAAIAAIDFTSQKIKEGKQAEFLVYDFFPWRLVDRIGVLSPAVRVGAERALAEAGHRPRLDVVPNWYY
jgi:ssDNA thymidine ADP-ribosyltransferase, DarT